MQVTLSCDEMQLDEKRKKFYTALSDTIKEDKDGEISSFLIEKPGQYIDEQGRLSKGLINELREFKKEELVNLEESIKNARIPTEDLFGIKRQFCKVCEQGCNGYLPNKLMIPQSGEFPTFCKNCKCPAHFHTICIEPQDIVYPEELKETIQNHNFGQKDLNFNCVLLAFQIRDQQTQTQNTSELLTILKEEGLEIISMDTRSLEIEEAIYLKSRMVVNTENLVLQSLGIAKHGGYGQGKSNDLRKDGQHGSAFIGKHGANDPYLLNKHADQKEARLINVTQKMVNNYPKEHLEHIQGVTTIKHKKVENSQLTQQNLTAHFNGDTINQRVPLSEMGGPSIARTSNVDMTKDHILQGQALEESMNLMKRESLVPRNRDKTFKVKSHAKARSQNKRKLGAPIQDDDNEEIQELILVDQISKDVLLHELIMKDVILLAVGSAMFQNLEQQIRMEILPKIQIFLPFQEMPMLYLSDNKIKSLEDCILFFPGMFKLTKSIVVSEPLTLTALKGSEPGADATSDIQLELRRDDINKDLMDKLQELNVSSLDDGDNGGIIDDTGIERFFKNRGTLRIKTSSKLKKMIIQRETLKITQKEKQASDIFGNKIEGEELSWLDRVKEREKAAKKKTKLLSQHNKILYNFGVLHDFFNYSAMSIQNSQHQVDLSNPSNEKEKDSALYSLKQELDSKQNNQQSGKANIFAIAKIGLPNLILPSSLDIKLSNYNNYSQYLHLCDSFFPNLSTSQHSVLVLRPLIIKNGLNDYLVQILKINDFIILKRKIRMLTKSEVVFLAEAESITNDKCDMYYNLMMSGECEIVVVSKLGAVSDLKSIADGSAPLGRRRVGQLDEDTSMVRTNVDAVSSMFEITPFTSMSEFLDLEDFIVSHSKLDKYKKLIKKNQAKPSMGRINEQLYYSKIEQIRRELNIFSRHFNLVAHAPSSEKWAQQEMCVLMPEVATIEEVILLLNPIYANYQESAERLLFRMGFKTLKHKLVSITEQEAVAIFKEKMSNTSLTMSDHSLSFGSLSSMGGEKMAKLLAGSQVYMWHLTKISGQREVRQLFRDAQIELDDILRQRVKSTPFKPQYFPFLFLFMDSPSMFEITFKMLWGQEMCEVTGQHLIDVLDFKSRREVLELALQVTVGDKIKELTFDRLGRLIENINKDEASHIVNTKIPQLYQLFGNPKGSTAVHTVVESQSHGLYEIRFTRLPHKKDFYNAAIVPSQLSLQKLKHRYFTKFQALNYYYNEVNKHYYNICPAFYRFKICPLINEGQTGHEMLNRVYEVEEYMGRPFIEDVANMHQEHIRMIKTNMSKTPSSIGKSVQQMMLGQEQKSMPPYIWGSKIAQLCSNLEKVKGTQSVIGCGRIMFENQHLHGEVKDPKEYYAFDKRRFSKYLEDFKKGWNYYLSVLECDLIESKLRRIIDSQTFKHTRQPGFLSLIPDRMHEINLRISEKVQILIESSMAKESNEKFYEHLKTDTVHPENEERSVNMVQSIMHTLYIENTRVGREGRNFASNNGGQGFKIEDLDRSKIEKDKKNNYTVQKECAVVGVEIARRPKYQLFASILYLFNFWFRKVDRKTELFDDFERQHSADSDSESRKNAEILYDQILDTLVNSIKDNYGRDEINFALDMITQNELQKDESNFEKLVREKQELEKRLNDGLKLRVEELMRAQRTQMTFDQLLQSLQKQNPKEEEKKQQEAFRKFVESKGYMDHQGEGFLGVLKQTQQHLGPYSIKMAHDHIKMIEISKKSQQEKISFVKMEYFLYAVTEAHRCVTELKQMEARINEMQDELEIAIIDIGSIGNIGPSASGLQKSKSELAFYQQKLEIHAQIQKQSEQLRYQISMKESELVLIFRELMSWDYYVPDHYFDRDLMLNRQRQEQLQESFLLPTRTFWRPVYFDQYKEPNILHSNFVSRLRDFSGVVLPKELMHDGSESERQAKPRKGVLVSCLRPYDAKEQTDFIKLDKFFSKGEFNEQKELDRIKTTIQNKLKKEVHDHGVRFKDPSS